MINATLPKRKTDDWGSGAYGASRGGRTHRGIDYICYPNTQIKSTVTGTFTKYGICYSDNPFFRYVEIQDDRGYKHRFFYVRTHLPLGAAINASDYIGFAQNIAGRYSRPDKIMLNHIHYEIKYKGEYFDPETYVNC